MRITAIVVVLIFLLGCKYQEPKVEKLSGAGRSLNDWNLARAYPYGKIYPRKYKEAFASFQSKKYVRNNEEKANWQALGPQNVGGRTLCLAFHPANPDVIFAGTASGGLWKTTTAGRSFMQNGGLKLGWEQVPISFPVLAIASIAIDPENPDIMFVGTGEVYNDDIAMPGVYNRYTRGTYGIGILKSIDGGKNWFQVIDWSKQELTGVQDIVINPLNSKSIYAATTEGLYRSKDKGESWNLIHDLPMAIDIELNASDTSIVFVTHGSYLNNNVSGIYRSENAGESFQKLTNGLPANYSGRATIKSAVTDPSLLYAYISDSGKGLGLFKSQNSGDDWEMMVNKDITKWQGWYAGDLAIKPDESSTVIAVGIDVHRTTNGGTTLGHLSSWEAWNKGKVSVLGNEGLPNYVHADIHKVYYHPIISDRVFFATDGGVFVSEDNGENYEGRNGGLQVTQFYANFSSSTTDPFFAVGGMQDNASVIYDGSNEWVKILSGDGMCTAINYYDDNIVYASSQYGNIYRSDDRGQNWMNIKPQALSNDNISFNVPFMLAPADPNLMYLGGQRIYMSENGGDKWRVLTPKKVDGNNTIVSINVAPTDPSLLYITTSPSSTSQPKLLKSNGGEEWEVMEGLPDRLAMDVAIHPDNSNIVYVVYSGFNTQHIWKTINGGVEWFPIDDGLPDIPYSSVLIDPNNPEHVYFGHDLGVLFTPDGGTTWQSYQDGLPYSVMTMDLSISRANNKIRVATHGNGVYEGDLVSITTRQTDLNDLEGFNIMTYPNPTIDRITMEWDHPYSADIQLALQNDLGQVVRILSKEIIPGGQQRITASLGDLPAGNYFYVLTSYGQNGQRGQITGKIVKQ